MKDLPYKEPRKKKNFAQEQKQLSSVKVIIGSIVVVILSTSLFILEIEQEHKASHKHSIENDSVFIRRQHLDHKRG